MHTLVGTQHARGSVSGSKGGTLACPPFPALARSMRRRLISSLRSAMPMCSSLPHAHGKRQCTARGHHCRRGRASTGCPHSTSQHRRKGSCSRTGRAWRTTVTDATPWIRASCEDLAGCYANCTCNDTTASVTRTSSRSSPPHTPHARSCAGCLGPRDEQSMANERGLEGRGGRNGPITRTAPPVRHQHPMEPLLCALAPQREPLHRGMR